MIELLAPAANLNSGIAAVNAGADALYIGGASFGAREKAGNSIEDIGILARYAHLFGAKVYLTMNTIIYDNELDDAHRLVWQAWDAGVDALIVQDMALLEMDLPPIALHSSTQTFNLTPDRVRFLEDVGFARVILERGITLSEIEAIRRVTSVELEAFVHGAICVGYSGQCYLSEALCGRSGNRGSCAQPCRSRWNLVRNDRIIRRDETLLSVGDLNLSGSLTELIEAGVSSLKIEGRLKDEAYVVNNTAHYNRKLVEADIKRSSSGSSTAKFMPNPAKSFSRSFSTYLLHERRPAGSLLNVGGGEYLGRVIGVGSDYFEIDNRVEINNGDGITFGGSGGGTNINTMQGDRIYPNRMDGVSIGVDIYRNLDRSFRPVAERKIDLVVEFVNGRITAVDSDGVTATVEYDMAETEIAKNPERAREGIVRALMKSGDTIFRITKVDVMNTPFLTAARLNELRRELLELMAEARRAHYVRLQRCTAISHPDLGGVVLDYLANVSNRLSREFYERCGANVIGGAFELERVAAGAALLRTRHCIRREIGQCLRDRGSSADELYIENNGRRLRLEFDCAVCEMVIVSI